MPTAYAVIGKPVASQDGPEKVSGKTIYPADIDLPGMLWGKVLRSPLPHAKIVHIDTSAAVRLPGVRVVLTGKDVPDSLVGRDLADIPLLARDKVRFVGDKVAVVAADDPDIAEEAIGLIDVQYEELPTIFDPVSAMEPGAPLVHDGSPTYQTQTGTLQPKGNIVACDSWADGDAEKGFQESDYVFEHTFTTTWVHQGYLEPYTCVVNVDQNGRLEVWANNKNPFRLRTMVAGAVGVPQDQVIIDPVGIGGDFGGKGGPMDVPLAALMARRTGRPVKMILSHIEEYMAGCPRHRSITTIKTGVKKDGRFWARDSRVVFDSGAYSGMRGSTNLRGGRQVGGGVYYIPNFRIDMYMVYTNNIPCGSYRAPGEPQTVFAVESHTDMIAKELGRDPYELRLQNVVREGQMTAVGERFYFMRGEETLRAAAEAADWYGPKKGPTSGRGIAFGQRPAAGATSVARVLMDATAHVKVYTAVPDTGVGAHTVQRQVVAEDLGIPVEDVSLERLGTDGVPFDTGAGAATTHNAGNAAWGAAQELRRKLTGLAAEFYGWPEEKIVFRAGHVFVEGRQGNPPMGDQREGVSVRELAAKCVTAFGGPIQAEKTFKGERATVTTFTAQVADLEVEPETGQVKVNRITTVHDVGTVLNPLGHQGQIDGAVIQGLGYALMEELQSEDGRISTLTMGEVKTPTTMDIPELQTVLLENEGGDGPYQGKGIGENPLPCVAPAIANAVYDAVGVRITDLPITAEEVRRALREKTTELGK